MTITQSDIEFYLSGGSDNTDPNASLGGAISSTAVQDNTLNNVFDDVSGQESQDGDTEYRCIYVKNNHASDTWYNVVVWISQETPADDQIDIGLDPAGVGDGSTTGVATTIPDESTAPEGVTFSHPLDKASGLSIGDIPAGQCQAIWLKRIVPAGTSSYADNSFQITVEGETV